MAKLNEKLHVTKDGIVKRNPPKKQPKQESAIAAELRSGLAGFTGTEEYHAHMLMKSLVFTDGVKYLADKAGAYWLIDVVASHQLKKKVRQMPFQVWFLRVYDDNSAVVTMQEDVPGRVRVRQEIPYSDFPLAEMKLYLEEGWVGDEQTGRKVMVLMLPSER